jgi:hypothetical protein
LAPSALAAPAQESRREIDRGQSNVPQGREAVNDDRVSTKAKERFNDDLEEKLKETAGPEIIRWVWSRYTPMAKGTIWEVQMEPYRKMALESLPH